MKEVGEWGPMNTKVKTGSRVHALSLLGGYCILIDSPLLKSKQNKSVYFSEVQSSLAEMSLLTRMRRGPIIKTKCWCSFLHFYFLHVPISPGTM